MRQGEANMEAAVENVTMWKRGQQEAGPGVQKAEGGANMKGSKAGALGDSGK